LSSVPCLHPTMNNEQLLAAKASVITVEDGRGFGLPAGL
jgi:hypothetical protein